MAEHHSNCGRDPSACQDDLNGMPTKSRNSWGESRHAVDRDHDSASDAQKKLARAARAASEDPEVEAARVLIQAGGTEPDAEFIPRRRPWLRSS